MSAILCEPHQEEKLRAGIRKPPEFPRAYTLRGVPVFGRSEVCYLYTHGTFRAAGLPYIDGWTLDEDLLCDHAEEARERWSDRIAFALTQALSGELDDMTREIYFVALRHLHGRGWPTDYKVQRALREGNLKVDAGVYKYKSH